MNILKVSVNSLTPALIRQLPTLLQLKEAVKNGDIEQGDYFCSIWELEDGEPMLKPHIYRMSVIDWGKTATLVDEYYEDESKKNLSVNVFYPKYFALEAACGLLSGYFWAGHELEYHDNLGISDITDRDNLQIVFYYSMVDINSRVLHMHQFPLTSILDQATILTDIIVENNANDPKLRDISFKVNDEKHLLCSIKTLLSRSAPATI